MNCTFKLNNLSLDKIYYEIGKNSWLTFLSILNVINNNLDIRS